MAAAVFYLLLAIWMEELSLIFRVAGVIGVALLAAAAWTLWEHYRVTQTAGNPVAALAALRRNARARGVGSVAVRSVRVVR